jgi:hypothetical protein
VSEGKVTESQANALGEVWKAFNTLYSSIAQEQSISPFPIRVLSRLSHPPGSRMLGVFLPTITLVLSDSESPGGAPVRSQAIAQLLSYASSSPAAFKVAAEMLPAETREVLEQSIRRAVGGSNSAGSTTGAKPQISLRSF